MASKPPTLKKASPKIASLLRRVRRRIRSLVFGEGIAATIAVMIVAFWIAFVFDYLPVRFGYSEASVGMRIGLLVLSAVAVLWVFYRLILRRLFVRMRDTSMAMLVEQKYQSFNDSLLATVSDIVGRRKAYKKNKSKKATSNDASIGVLTQTMVTATQQQAEAHVDEVEVERVVNGASFRKAAWLAGGLLCSALVLFVAKPSVATLAFKRLYLLENEKWPRQTDIQFGGISVARDVVVDSIPEFNTVLKPVDGVVTVAKGSMLSMAVTAQQFEATERGERELQIPETCWLNYQVVGGSGGSQPFKRIGTPRDQQQNYQLSGGPLENVITDVTFNVSGGDDRLSGLKIQVVDEPIPVKTTLRYTYPDYMLDEQAKAFAVPSEVWSGRAEYPFGTKVTLEIQAKDPLSKVYVRRLNNDSAGEASDGESAYSAMEMIPCDSDTFEYEIPFLAQRTALEFFLCDSHGVVNEQAHVVAIDVSLDQAPEIQCRLSGIGTAVTPDVQIPIEITVDDDHGVDKVWVELEIGAGEPTQGFVDWRSGPFQKKLDFRELRSTVGEAYRLPTDGNATLAVTVMANDRFDLEDQPNVGESDRYELQVVSPEELLRILEQAEVGQRRRLEQIVREVKEQKDYLVRTKSRATTSADDSAEPGDEPRDGEPGDDQTDVNGAPERHELRRLFAQRAQLQNDKSLQEVLGCVSAFENLRLQLINNRVNADARQKRFEEGVIAPLSQTANGTMTELAQRLKQLENQLREVESLAASKNEPTDPETIDRLQASADQTAVDSIVMTDQVLVELNEVLNLLIKHETQNELLDIVRQMIEKQEELKERTKKERQKKAFEGLLD